MKDGNWTMHNKARRDFGQQHDPYSTKSLWGPNHPKWIIKKWAGGQIVTESKIDQDSCTPILTIKLMTDEQLNGAYFLSILNVLTDFFSLSHFLFTDVTSSCSHYHLNCGEEM